MKKEFNNFPVYLFLNCEIFVYFEPGQLSQCTVWLRTGRPGFDPEDFSSNLCVQTGSGAHPASYTVGTGGSFPGGKAAGA
jgi:hypothetical protein